jgi:hypothetical protein
MKITFETDNAASKEHFYPLPANECIPEYLKNLEDNYMSMKSCPPAMDFVNSGYLIRSCYEYDVDEKLEGFQKGREVMSVNTRPQHRKHPSIYTGNTLPRKGYMQNAYARIETDFVVRTPPGYSCFICHPYYHEIQGFTVLPGIIDTDKFDYVLSIVVSPNIKNLKIQAGDILAQIIPFKRDSWTSEVTEKNQIASHVLHYINGAYKKLFHSKKVFK